MIRLAVHVVGVHPDTGREVDLAKIETERFDPDHLDTQVVVALESARTSVKGATLASLRPWRPEVSAVLTADDEYVRPSLHLTVETLQRLAEAGAAFDFDPYI